MIIKLDVESSFFSEMVLTSTPISENVPENFRGKMCMECGRPMIECDQFQQNKEI